MNTQPTSLRPDVDTPANQPDTLTGSPATLPSHRLMEPFRQPAFSGILAMLAISGGAFFLYDWFSSPRRAGDNDSLMIMLHYGLAGRLFVVVADEWLFSNTVGQPTMLAARRGGLGYCSGY